MRGGEAGLRVLRDHLCFVRVRTALLQDDLRMETRFKRLFLKKDPFAQGVTLSVKSLKCIGLEFSVKERL